MLEDGSLQSVGKKIDQKSKANLVPRVSIVLPCLNEEITIDICVTKARMALKKLDLSFEIIVVDNGSTDRSASKALEAGARVVVEKERGYGRALRSGIESSRGDIILMADADDTYDLSQMTPLLQPLIEGRADFVIGNRLAHIQKGAMPFMHRYLGNPILSFLMRLFFSTPLRDVHCGLRAFTRNAYEQLNLMTTGMEFASEMVFRAVLLKLRLVEIDISYHLREGESKLRTFRDGWRHLRLMLLYSPDFLFIFPAAILWTFGILVVSILAGGPVALGKKLFDVHTMLIGAVGNITGLQIGVLGLIAKAYGHFTGLRTDRFIEWWSGRLRLEHGLILGAVMFMIGVFSVIHVGAGWPKVDLRNQASLRLLIFGLVVISNGITVAFASFILSLMTIRSKLKKTNL